MGNPNCACGKKWCSSGSKIQAILFSLLFLAIPLLYPFASPAEGAGPADGLVGYWSMDEGDGATASDSSGLGNTGGVYGGATWTTGKVGGALSFDGSSGTMNVPNVTGLPAGNTPHTIAAWVKVTSLPSNRAWILLLGNEGTGSHHWLLTHSGWTQLGVWNGAQAHPTLPVGEWKHLAVTFDGTTLTGYMDGVTVGSSAAQFDLEGMPLTLGQGHIWENYFSGLIDDVRIYSRALDATEIAALANAAPDDGGNLLPQEQELIALLNDQRVQNGLAALPESAGLCTAARNHSVDMAQHNFMSHTGSDGSDPGDRILATGYQWGSYGENVGAGYSTPAAMVNAWMNSPGHRANILSNFCYLGVGYAYSSQSTYGHYWTLVLACPLL